MQKSLLPAYWKQTNESKINPSSAEPRNWLLMTCKMTLTMYGLLFLFYFAVVVVLKHVYVLHKLLLLSTWANWVLRNDRKWNCCLMFPQINSARHGEISDKFCDHITFAQLRPCSMKSYWNCRYIGNILGIGTISGSKKTPSIDHSTL